MCGGKKVHCNQNIHFHLNQSYAPLPFGAIVWIQMVLMDMGHDYVCPVYIRNVLCIFVTLGRKAAYVPTERCQLVWMRRQKSYHVCFGIITIAKWVPACG